jgi:hypothetical protein
MLYLINLINYYKIKTLSFMSFSTSAHSVPVLPSLKFTARELKTFFIKNVQNHNLHAFKIITVLSFYRTFCISSKFLNYSKSVIFKVRSLYNFANWRRLCLRFSYLGMDGYGHEVNKDEKVH